MSEFGINYMKGYPLEKGFGQIVNVVKRYARNRI